MGDITAVILAAGMGVRMGPRGRLMPKGLIPVGGVPMVEQSVATLRDWGAARIVIVTGHLQEQYQALFGDSDIELVYNDAYASTGSLLSLVKGLERVEGPCVIIESDLIYAPQALDPVDGIRNVFPLSTPTHAGDEVYAWTRDEDGAPILDEISKDRAARIEAPMGEMVGLTGLNAQSVPELLRVANDILHDAPKEHYEPGLVALSKRMPVHCHLFDDLPWAEIDDEDMLERAAREVYPRVLAARG